MGKVACSEEELNALQWTTLEYYIREMNYRNGLIADKTQPGSPASIAAVGMALASIPILAARQLLPRLLLAEVQDPARLLTTIATRATDPRARQK